MERRIYTTTKAQMFAQVITIIESTENVPNKVEIIERLQREIDLLNTKKTGGAKAKENAELNTNVTEIVLEVLRDADKPLTITEIQNADSRLAVTKGITNSRITANLTKLVKAGEVNRVEEKKKSYYSIAG